MRLIPNHRSCCVRDMSCCIINIRKKKQKTYGKGEIVDEAISPFRNPDEYDNNIMTQQYFYTSTFKRLYLQN